MSVAVGVPVPDEVPTVVGVDIEDDERYIELQNELREKTELVMTLQRNMADKTDRYMDLLEITEKKDKLILDLQKKILDMQIRTLKE
jgi:hypothetical protein